MNQLKLLLIDLTRLGGSAATGALKQAIFGDWPDHDFAHLHGHGAGHLLLRTGATAVLSETVYNFGDGALDEACRLFDPDIILFRPVADHEDFHKVAMRITSSSQAPLALWLMDDWPERLRAEDPDRHTLLDKDLRWLFNHSSVNFAISEDMARAFGERYGVPFGVIHNGVNPSEWPDRRQSRNDSKVLLRYAGSLAPDTTRDSIHKVAQVVSELVGQGAPIRFEGQTQKVWHDRYGDLFQGLPGVSMRVAKLSVEAYRQWLCDADIILIGYNFDDETRRYLQFSFANKVPESLASGAAVLAYGPEGLQTIDYLSRHKIAKVVSKPGAESLKAGLTELMKNNHMRKALGESGREHAFDKFDLTKQRNKMTTALRDISQNWTPPSTVLNRSRKAQFDECRFVYEALGARFSKGVMIDVGAHVGSSLIAFAKSGWNIWAFEPDPQNRQKLNERVKNRSNVCVINKAVSDNVKSNVAFYSSDVSTGISGLTAFHESHEESVRIETTTLDKFISEHGLTEVDFLKIDVEGHEMDVLNGLDFDKIKPRAIVAEFEDDKTRAHGYLMPDLARRFEDAGYVVFVSEWHPIERYGIKHSWNRMRRYPCDTSPTVWGNLVAFLTEPEPKMLRRAFQRSLTVTSKEKSTFTKKSGKPTMSSGYAVATGPRSTYIRVAEHMIQHHPVVAQFLRFGIWCLRTLRRRIIGIGGLLLVALLLLLAAVYMRPDLWMIWAGSAGLVLSGAFAFLLVGYVRFIFWRRDRAYHAQTRVLEAQTKSLENSANHLLRKIVKLQATIERFERRSLTFEKRSLIFEKTVKESAIAARQHSVGIKQSLETSIDATEGKFKRWISQSHLQIQERFEKYDVVQSKRHDKVGHITDALKKKLGELNKKSRDLAKQTEEIHSKANRTITAMGSSVARIKRMSNSNAALVRPHIRQLSEVDLERLSSFWMKALDLKLTKSQLGYYAHKICLAEDAACGRLAAPVETMLLRLLAAQSLKGDRVEILEIGTLFGVGAACLSKLRAPYEREVQLTLLDPMEGYYQHGSLDPVTGVPVSEAVLRDNLTQLGVPDDHWRLIKKMSTDPEAREVVGDRQYDMLIIDGDHTIEGVTRDFEIYGDIVKSGGLLIFDDYDT